MDFFPSTVRWRSDERQTWGKETKHFLVNLTSKMKQSSLSLHPHQPALNKTQQRFAMNKLSFQQTLTMASLNNWDRYSNKPLMPYNNMRKRCVVLHHYWLNTKYSAQWAAVPRRTSAGQCIQWPIQSTHPVPQGLLDQAWFGFSSSY